MPSTPLTGRLLVAAPELTDPNFARSVVLLLDHGEDGTLGVVLNRPTPVDVVDVLPGWEGRVSVPDRVFQGGPVALDTAMGVVTLPGRGRPSHGVDRVTGPFGVVDLDAEPAPAVAQVTGLRIFAGHAGWSPGQLEAELEVGGWYVVDAEPGDATTPDPTTLWRRVMRRQGGDLALLSTYPPDPRLN